MKVMTVRDIRQRWPEAERALHEHDEVIVTRDGRPVARILPPPEPSAMRPRVDWSAHRRWRASFWRKQPKQPSTEKDLAADRAERD
jgi:antitoxin (DNA-binding transcriptional repressor) of toxin-antitoxin stability system